MNKFKLTLAALCLALGASSFAERAPEYISPNNDGVQDTLVIPLKIKEKRYIKEWKLIIYNENGDVVRTIGNKRKDEEKLTFTTFFKKLFNPKSGVDIPSSIVWNGRLGDEASALGLVPGDVAPDGKYYYIFRATDDNDNTGVSARYYVIVDCTAPVITLETMTDDEKSFGEGTKPSVKIKQTGSAELNAKLAKERAQNVFDVLTKQYGVSAKQLTLDAKGGVDTMFLNDPQLSRSVIISEVK